MPRHALLALAALTVAACGPAALAQPATTMAPVPTPATPVPNGGVGARFVNADSIRTLPNERIFALLVLLGGKALNKAVCQKFVAYYTRTFEAPYAKYVFLPVTTEPVPSKIRCENASDLYDQTLFGDLSQHPKLYLSRLGERSAYLMLIHKDGTGALHNRGYVIFDSTQELDVQAQLLLFELYYREDRRCWSSTQITRRGRLGSIWDAVNGGASCPVV